MRAKFVHALWMLCAAIVPVRTAGDAPSTRIPAAIVAPDDLRRHMAMMLERSATFRQQCRRLEAAQLRVEIHVDSRLIDAAYRALTTIHRTADSIDASVAITPFGDPTEWLAHELEHVLEQIDGVDLRHGGPDVWPSPQGWFETRRAIQAGQAVRRELRESRRLLAHAVKAGSHGDD